MEKLGLDGHWLVAAVAYHASKPIFNTADLSTPIREQVNAGSVLVTDSLYNEIVAGYEAETELDDDQLHRLDAYLEENFHYIITATEKTLTSLLELMSMYCTPVHCQHRQVNRYLNGYSMKKGDVGYLHFYFRDLP